MCRSLIIKKYEESFLKRYDKDEAVPYLSVSDFAGLRCDEGSFTNKNGVEIRYFIYSYEGFDPRKLILFCPGMGPGHTAYLSEIEAICRAGHRVLTLDYTGCGASGGDRMPSVNAPVSDAEELLKLMRPDAEVIPVGHSLGGYTALTLANVVSDVKRAVIISGFVSISDEMTGIVKLRVLADVVKRYEARLDLRLGRADNRSYLAKTDDKLLWIHSKDDPMVSYKYNAGQVSAMRNPNVALVTVENKKHNPQYSPEALAVMNEWMGGYYRLIAEKKLNTPEERKAYFSDKPAARMTEIDEEVFGEVIRFIGE